MASIVLVSCAEYVRGKGYTYTALAVEKASSHCPTNVTPDEVHGDELLVEMQ